MKPLNRAIASVVASHYVRRTLARRILVALEEEPDGRVQELGGVVQRGSTDPVGAAFVFLDLLRREVQRLRQPFLAGLGGDAAVADTPADMGVERGSR